MVKSGEEMEVRRKMNLFDLFDKKFVYLDWDDTLKGKKVFAENTLPRLRELVIWNRDLQEVSENVSENVCDYTYYPYPFMSHSGMPCAMVYYDPNYECKLAYVQGKTIQYKSSCIPNDKWEDCVCRPEWTDHCEYRVKPEDNKCNTCSYQCEPDMPCRTCRDGSNYKSRVVVKSKQKHRKTNRELAQWVASGYGECMCDDIAMSCWRYVCDEADIPVKDGVKIRGWDETEWSEPLIEE